MLTQHSIFHSSQNERVRALLKTALKNVLVTFVLGAGNKISDIKKSNGNILFSDYRYNRRGQYVKKGLQHLTEADKLDWHYNTASGKMEQNTNRKWSYHCDEFKDCHTPKFFLQVKYNNLNPIKDPKFQLTKSNQTIIVQSLLAAAKRKGNCGDRVMFLEKYLWENKTKDIQRIEMISFDNFDHCMIIVNREGNANDPKTWGNALIMETWYLDSEMIFTPKEFMAKALEVKNYIRHQNKALDKLPIAHATMPDDDDIIWSMEYEILPHQHLYPTYKHSPFCPVDHYYQVLNEYTLDLARSGEALSLLKKARSEHETKFQDCLEGLRNKRNSTKSL